MLLLSVIKLLRYMHTKQRTAARYERVSADSTFLNDEMISERLQDPCAYLLKFRLRENGMKRVLSTLGD